MLNKTLLGTAAVLLTVVGAQAADLPSKKAAPATYVKICDAYGAGFFFIPGTDTCMKVGGYVRVDYDYRPERKSTTYATATTATAANAIDQTTSGFYNRGTVQLDARTPTSMGVARTFMALRMETGAGVLGKASTSPSLEGAFVQWAGFTFGQAPQPAAFMSSWAYNTHYWGGWPNGVRQLTYTAVLGGGFSATAGVTDMGNYAAVATAPASPQATIHAPDYNGIVYVGNVRYDQSWGAVQVFGAAHSGGNLTGGTQNAAGTVAGGTTESGYAIGIGASFKLPMLAAGDEIQLTFAYNDRLQNIIGDAGVNTPSSAAYGSNPVGGPTVDFANGTGWVAGAQLRHYWTSNFRSQFYASYTSRDQHVVVGGSGNALSLGKAFIYSPARDFDIGLEVNYIRANWDQASLRTVNNWGGRTGDLTESNVVTKLRVQRNF